MSFLITDSREALPMETLPALKITHFSGAPARGCVYAYLRCYVRRGSMPFSITVFDEAPRASQRAGFAVTPDETAARYLFVSCSKNEGDALWLYENDRPVRRLAELSVRHSAGCDEQGWYWGAEGVISAETFRTEFGRTPKAGDLLPACAYLYDEAETAFGSSFPIPDGTQVPAAAGFDSFVAVPY